VNTSLTLGYLLSGKSLSQLTSGYLHNCIIAYDSTNRLFPVAVSGDISGKKILQIIAGDSHNCVIANDSNSYCWGWNKLFLFLRILY
jgi:alpha-tubulin suppressor-like RCC1 family protein